MENTHRQEPALIRLSAVGPYLGVSRSTVYKLEATDPDFPTVIRFSKRCAGVRRPDLDLYLAKKIEQEVNL
ncbi:MAG: hypothetical protein VR73_14730 [Gammaproteobacteria bacterium BRH_c0]|nr:MAG: hypothetical protein VR73_14730 [Gammaproteobacteria bacterium BRH_c0]